MTGLCESIDTRGDASPPAPGGTVTFPARITASLGKTFYSVREQATLDDGFVDAPGATEIKARNLAELSPDPTVQVPDESVVFVAAIRYPARPPILRYVFIYKPATARRGRMELPVHFECGLFSVMGDTPWLGGHVANGAAGQLHAIGRVTFPSRGAGSRPAALLEIVADADCTVRASLGLREIDFAKDPPTWNEYAPRRGGSWQTPGCMGTEDAIVIGSMSLKAGTAAAIGGEVLSRALLDGGEINIIVNVVGPQDRTVQIRGRVLVEFDRYQPAALNRSTPCPC